SSKEGAPYLSSALAGASIAAISAVMASGLTIFCDSAICLLLLYISFFNSRVLATAETLQGLQCQFPFCEASKIRFLPHPVLLPIRVVGASHAWPTKRLEAQQICFPVRRSWGFVARQATAGPKKKAAPPQEPQSYVMHRHVLIPLILRRIYRAPRPNLTT